VTDIARSHGIGEVPLEAGGTVELLLSSSDLRIRGTDIDRVILRTRNGRPVDGELTVETEPGRVRIRDAESSARLGPLHLGRRGGIDLDVDVPRTAVIVCRMLSGDVVADGIGGASRWNSASGDIRIAVDAGPVAIETMSGDAVMQASMPLAVNVRTVSGDVRVRAPRLETMTMTTTSGDIAIAAGLAPGARHVVSSVSGDVSLETDSPVRVETHSLTGDVKADGPHRTEGGRGNRTVIVGDGSAVLAVSTTSGDVRIRSALGRDPARQTTSPEPPAAPEPPTDPGLPVVPDVPVIPELPVVVAEAEAAPNLVRDVPPAPGGDEPAADRREAERLEVLRALERGELDVETASRRLEILDDAGPRAFRGWW
jgi:hypothetical protein